MKDTEQIQLKWTLKITGTNNLIGSYFRDHLKPPKVVTNLQAPLTI